MSNVMRIDPREPGADIRMMQTPDLWPLGSVLPLTRGPLQTCELGMLISMPGIPRWTVFKSAAGIYDDGLRRLLSHGSDEIGASWAASGWDQREEYADAEGVFDAGWRVS